MALPHFKGWRLLKDAADLRRWRGFTSAQTRPDPPEYPCLVRIYTSEDLWHSDEYLAGGDLTELLALLQG